MQHLGGGFGKCFQHILPELGLRTLVGFVHDDAIPGYIEYLVVLVELAAHLLRPAQVLHRGEIDIVQPSEATGVLHIGKMVAFLFGAVVIAGSFKAEYLLEIFVPPRIDHGAVGENDGAPVAHTADNLKGGKRLAEAHLGIPQHTVRLAKTLASALYCLFLFGAEDDR